MARSKSMCTASAHRRKGVAAALLEHLIEVARNRAYRRVSLETGSTEPFTPARALYVRFGFVPCGAFGDYVDNSFSTFMTRELDTAGIGSSKRAGGLASLANEYGNSS